MKKFALFFGILSILFFVLPTFAENSSAAFDIEQFSLEELREIKEQVDSRITELEKQWAIEHGDRTITFDQSEITLFVRQTSRAKAIITRVTDEAPKNTNLVWSTSDASIAKVSSEGTVTAIAYGDAVITASAKDNDCIFGSFAVHVVLPVTKISIRESNLTLLLNDNPKDAKAILHANVEPQNAYHQTVTWKSSNDEIVRVDQKGNIQGLKPGTANITATSTEPASGEGSPKKASISVTVVQGVNIIELSDKEIILDKGKTKRIKATVNPENATKKSVSWTTSDANIANVSSEGVVTAKNCGECDIICSAMDGSGITAKCHVVIKQLVTNIKLSETKIVLPSGNTQIITATISPVDATSKEVTWVSSNKNIATVSPTGVITAKNGGDCVITCKTKDGSEKSATVSVHVPTFSVQKTDYTVTSKKGIKIPVIVNGYYTITASSNSSCFDFDWEDTDLVIDPLRAGSGTIKLTNEEIKQDVITLKITIDHRAVYDTTSYPKGNYKDILRYPSSHKGDQIHIYGKVLQKVTSGSTVILRVGTSGYGHYDSVFWVEYNTKTVGASVIEDDFVTIYGKCTGTYTYTSTFNQSITLPSMEAEKIIIGSKSDE